MTPRSIRRAAERKAQKLARKQEQQSAASPAQIAANRANALLSTGPRTAEGQARSSANALKTGLTGRTVLLPGDDAAVYCAHVNQLAAEYQPAGLRESNLVLAIADTEWRLRRMPVLELALYARGRDEFDEKFSSQPDPNRRAVLTDLETLLVYEKQLRNLHLQEARLRRAREKDMAELQALQNERAAREAAAVEAAAETGLASNFHPPVSADVPHAGPAIFASTSPHCALPDATSTTFQNPSESYTALL